jgi:hypothetical protein
MVLLSQYIFCPKGWLLLLMVVAIHIVLLYICFFGNLACLHIGCDLNKCREIVSSFLFIPG